MRQFVIGLTVGLLTIPAMATATPIQLLTNGNFESGTLAGWTKTVQAGSAGDMFVDTPGTTTPLSAHASVGAAANGSFYAVTDQTGPGAYSLIQSFTLAPSGLVTLDFSMFANDWDSGPIVGAQGLNFTGAANQHARVDILSAAAGAFDVGGTVLGNFYLGVDAGVDPHAFTNYSFNITSIVGAGGTFKLRFAEVDNSGFFNMGVDNVSIQADVNTVPEPATMFLLGSGLAAVGMRRYRQRR